MLDLSSTSSIDIRQQPPEANSNRVPRTLLDRIQALDASRHERLYAGFVVGNECVGQVLRAHLNLLLDCRDKDGRFCFKLVTSTDNGEVMATDNWNHSRQDELALVLIDHGSSEATREEQRTVSMDAATQTLIDNGLIMERHTDTYPIVSLVRGGDRDEVLCLVNRNAAPFFGVTSVGVHLMCFVVNTTKKKTTENVGARKACAEEAQISLWMAQRASNKSNFPSLWDPTVAGGQPAGLSLLDNLVKEAGEEAGISPDFVYSNAKSASCLSQMTSRPTGKGLKQSLYYCWDLMVGKDFVPRAVDGEVQQFQLWTAEELEEEVRYGDKLRPAMRLVITDFLIRHGVITPDEPDYAKIQSAMHRDRLVLWPRNGLSTVIGQQGETNIDASEQI